jgi:two-component system LytT family response regulator
MLKICIIDDEQDARSLLREMLADLAHDCRIIGEANNKATAIELLKTTQPDVVFLDIDLKDGTGFEVLSALPPPQYGIVFTTAFNQFAIKAFKVNALDYLLKPIELEELNAAVTKVKKGQSVTDFQEQIKQLLTTTQTHKSERLTLNTADGIYFLAIEDILHLESSGNYTTFWTIDGEKVVVSSNLGSYEHLVSNTCKSTNMDEQFFRVHQSHIIRISKVKQMMKQPDGEFVVLDNGTRIPISRRRREAFLMAMNQ